MTSATSQDMAEAVESKSPCVNVCQLENRMHDMICIGCLRTQEEIADWRSHRDPIDRFSAKLISEGALTQADYEAMINSVAKEIEEAVDFAEKSPLPDVSTILDGVDSGLLGARK